jgi:hypothetical protein
VPPISNPSNVGDHASCGDAETSPPQPHRWIFQDIATLTLLRASADRIAKALSEHARRRPILDQALQGHVIEVGAGLAALSLALAKLFPSTHFTAMDSNSSATSVARLNVATSGLSSRFSIRLRDLVHLDERASYSVAWLPAPFLPRQGAGAALDRLNEAIEPGGFLIIGNSPTLACDASTATNGARLLRSNGYVWRTEELTGFLRHLGYRELEHLPCADGMELAIARRS